MALVNGTTVFSAGNLDTLTAASRQADNTHWNDAGAASAAKLVYNALQATGSPYSLRASARRMQGATPARQHSQDRQPPWIELFDERGYGTATGPLLTTLSFQSCAGVAARPRLAAK